jgi:hypothetical protein
VSGCIGGTVLYTNSVDLPAPTLVHGAVVSTGDKPGLAAADLKESWGPPAKIEHVSAHEERWIYNGPEKRWGGVILALVVLPLPLCVPVGHERATMLVRDNVVVQATVEVDDESGTWCGLVWSGGPCGELKVGAVSFPDTHPDVELRRSGVNWSLPQAPSEPAGQ